MTAEGELAQLEKRPVCDLRSRGFHVFRARSSGIAQPTAASPAEAKAAQEDAVMVRVYHARERRAWAVGAAGAVATASSV
jgi:hypothetical protein